MGSNWWDVLENGTVHAIFDTVGQIGTGPRATAMLAKDGVFLTIAHRGPSVGLDPNPQSNVAQITSSWITAARRRGSPFFVNTLTTNILCDLLSKRHTLW